jgi:hypothetical protein
MLRAGSGVRCMGSCPIDHHSLTRAMPSRCSAAVLSATHVMHLAARASDVATVARVR